MRASYIKLLILTINLIFTNGEKLLLKRNKENTNQAIIYKNEVPTDFSVIVNDALNQRITTRLTKKTVNIKAKKQGMKYLSALNTDPFEFKIQCFTNSCIDYAEQVQKGSEYIAQAFEFYEIVKVNVTIFPFCNFLEDNQKCSSIMGITYPPTFIPLTEKGENNSPFLYPQALVKQLDLDGSIEYDNEYDFMIYLNSNYNPIASKDNRSLIATHEIIHGLGFFHQMAPISVYISNLSYYIENDFVLPPLSSSRQEINGVSKIVYDGWTPFSVFDKYIVSTANPKNYIYKQLLNFYNHDINFTLDMDYPTNEEINNLVKTINELLKDKEAYENGVNIAKIFSTLDSVGFKTDSGSIISLQTFDGVYESASSISHISVPFPCTSSSSCNYEGFNGNIGEDYLMFFAVITSASTDTLINTFSADSKHGIIGPDLVKIMTTLGWTEKNLSRDNSKYSMFNSNKLYTNEDDNDYNNGIDDENSGFIQEHMPIFVVIFSILYSLLNYII